MKLETKYPICCACGDGMSSTYRLGDGRPHQLFSCNACTTTIHINWETRIINAAHFTLEMIDLTADVNYESASKFSIYIPEFNLRFDLFQDIEIFADRINVTPILDAINKVKKLTGFL